MLEERSGSTVTPQNVRSQVYLDTLVQPQAEADEKQIKEARPVGSDAWIKRTAGMLGLDYTPRARGRPVGRRKLAEKEAERQ